MTENGAAKQNELYQGVHKASTAYKLLASMGWKEGQGLGAQKQGITSHVKVKKKFDSTGVGMAEKHDRQRDWTIGMVAFDRILSGLKEVAARHDSSDESDDDTAPAKASTSSSSDSEQKACPAKKAKAKGKQAAVQKKKGKKAKEPTPSDSGDESTSSSSSSEDEDVAKRSPAPSKLATHVGRYHKRERAKSVRGYSAGDLAAILGAAPGSDGADAGGPVWEPPSVAAKDSDESSLMPLDPVDEEEEDEVPAGDSKAGQDAEGGAPARFWWSGMFVRAGRMGSTRHELHSKKVTAASAAAGDSGTAIKITGFSEQDQENLYTQAHLGATHNKQGLGKADAPKKVAGARWQGTKTRLDSDSDEDEAQEGGSGGDSDSSSDDEVPGAVVVIASKKEQAEGHVAKEVLMLPPAKPAAGAGAAGRAVAAKRAEKGAKGEGEKGEKKRKREEKKSEEEVLQAKAGKKGAAGKKDKSKGDAKEEAPKVKAEKADKDKAEKTQKVDKVEKEGRRVSKDEQQEVGAEGKVQWKKLAKQVLKASPKQRLKMDLFKQQVLQAAGLGKASGSDKKLMKKIKALPELFEVGDKFVKLL